MLRQAAASLALRGASVKSEGIGSSGTGWAPIYQNAHLRL